MKVVIIEDEKLTAKDLARTLLQLDDTIDVIATLHSVEDAITFFEEPKEIDLIFSDIELGDGTSFDVFKKSPLSTPVIFCTAYSQYALDAFSTLGIDYILKPFSADAIEKAINKYHTIKDKFAQPTKDIQRVYQLLQQQLQPSSGAVIAKEGDKIIPLKLEDIAIFYFENGYTFAYTFSERKYFIAKTLEELEAITGRIFFRANRQHLVNRKAVVEASYLFKRKVIVKLTVPFKEDIIIGKLKITSFVEWLSTH